MTKTNFQKCKSCGYEISKGKKITCPQCGKINKKPFYQKPFFIIIVVLLVIGAFGGGSKDEKDIDKVKTGEVSTPAISDEKVEDSEQELIVITVDELDDVLGDNALRASDTYKGEYVELTGILSNIDSDGKYFSLGRLDEKFTMTNVMCMISKEHLDIVMDFEKKQEVTVIGTITAVGEVLGYTLKVETIK